MGDAADGAASRPRPLVAWRRWFDGGADAHAGERDALLEALFIRADEALLVCAPDGAVQRANPVALRWLAPDGRPVVGARIGDFVAQHPRGPQFPLHDGRARVRGADAAGRALHVRLTPLRGAAEGLVLVRLRDATEDVAAKERLRQMASFDSLTGLPNRALFRDRLAQAMARAQRHRRPMALMFLDLDRFQNVNDELGHEAGDRLLQHVAQTLTHCLRQVDSVGRAGDAPHVLARLGGDEFTVIVEEVASAEDAGHVAQRMLDALAEPVNVGGQEVVPSVSIGISLYPIDDVDLDTLIRHTDMAMYRSKSLGRGTFSFFSDDLTAAVTARVSLEAALRRAIERDEFALHFQPKADLRTGKVTGVEALLRWQRPGHGLVPPDRFVGVLEDTGLILPVGAWVIRAACTQLAAWDRQRLPKLRLAVNLSARQFRHLYLAPMVEDSLRENGIDPQRLEIELTESLLMEDNQATRAMLDSFRRLGVRLAIDDFGTGHSSLSYLKRFNIDTLKIDRSFVQSLPGSEEDAAICSAVIALGRSMRMNVVAEGVESEDQLQLLRDLGCDEAQGYWLGRPMPGAEFAAWYASNLRARSRRRARSRYTDTSPMTLFTLLD
jgi:diguanylate cyclase (GGDEF)-like protein